MVKFSIVDMQEKSRDIPYLLKELRQKNLISGTEKDAGGDTVYHTHNIVAVKRIIEEYEGLMLDIIKEK